ncbi:C45 family autoproteolytic acyltransferase/hydolase [Agromyces archimandritae]|uniref:Uncharacterized protein n=1 Tax=Agromyces archimandritae TaxID=2781962 RepID=A0A975IPS6_9MICO|nr:C45 family peptidase [Agromyces archimandritae]QTX05917.1 hypothetical protein G127AT_06925 [Agromyces archimandritae]
MIHENEPVAGLAWTVFAGDRETVFHELGARFAAEIREARERPGGQWERLVARTDGTAAGERVDAVIAATRRHCPVESAELDAMAAGAGIRTRELWTYNLRGDFGRDGTGCSDLVLGGVDAAGRPRLVLGHNEDGDGDLAGTVRLVTLRIEGDPDVTAVWYPGFVPANAFVATSAGVVWGMDHLPVVAAELAGAGRHLLARHAQRQPTGAAGLDAVRRIPCAGGFAFNVAGAGFATTVENAAGVIGEAESASGCRWHTNHLRYVGAGAAGLEPGGDDPWLAESRTRGAALATAAGHAASTPEVLSALRSPGVLNRSADIFTFVTAVADLVGDRIALQGEGAAWTGELGAFASGEARAA